MGTYELLTNNILLQNSAFLKQKSQQISVIFTGGGKRDRTADLLHAMQALSQLSYTPEKRRNLKEPAMNCQRNSFTSNISATLRIIGLILKER